MVHLILKKSPGSAPDSTRITSSFPLGEHALERGRCILIVVSHAQHALGRGKYMLFYVLHGQQALEREKYISFCVPLDQGVYNDGTIYCVPFHTGNTL